MLVTFSTSVLVTSSDTLSTFITITPFNTSNIISISITHQSTKSHQKSLLKVCSLKRQYLQNHFSQVFNRYFHVSHLVNFQTMSVTSSATLPTSMTSTPITTSIRVKHHLH